MNSSVNTDNVLVTLPNGAKIRVEATSFGGREKVSSLAALPFEDITNAVEGISVALIESLKKVGPRKTTIEFGIEVGVESGKLTALVCKGSGKANLKIALEWGNQDVK